MAAKKIRIVVHEGSNKGREYSIEDKATVGRAKDCEISIEDISISRRHCEIWLEQGVFHFKDLGSTNGVFHNAKKEESGNLVHGDRLKIGDLDFDVAEGTKAVRARSDEDLMPGKRKKPKPTVSKQQRMRLLMIVGLFMGVTLIGIAILKQRQYKVNEAPIEWPLADIPFVSEEDGFSITLPAEMDDPDSDWHYELNPHILSRNWSEKPPVLGNGMIMGGEIFESYKVHGWSKPYFGGKYRVSLFIEVLSGVAEDKDIVNYSLTSSDLDLPKHFDRVDLTGKVPMELEGIEWAKGGLGEQIVGEYMGATGPVSTVERGYCAFGNRYLVMFVSQKEFFDRVKEGGIKPVLATFQAQFPQKGGAVAAPLPQREIQNDADNLFRVGKQLAQDNPFNKPKMFEAFAKLREASLLYKKLEVQPSEANEAMRLLEEVQQDLQQRLEEYRNNCQDLFMRKEFERCMENAILVQGIVTDLNEEWRIWAEDSYMLFNQAFREYKKSR